MPVSKKTFDRVVGDALAEAETGERASHAASRRTDNQSFHLLDLKLNIWRIMPTANWTRKAAILVKCSGCILSNPA
jgi:hypothetical protein